MSVRNAITAVVVCTLLIAAIGASVGSALGALAPGYYRGVFPNGREPGFDPIAVGVGLGLTQGAAGGVAVGLAVVALLCWRDVRLRPAGEGAVDSSTAPRAITTRRVLLLAAATLGLGACLCAGAVAGLLVGERGAYHRRYQEEQAAIAPVLAADPAFARVEVHERSAGGVFLLGEVPNAVKRDQLQAEISRAVGERRARDAMTAVSVRP
jgi:hypothetical protein